MKVFITILNYIDIGAPLVTLFFFIKPFKVLPKELIYVFWFVCIQFFTNLCASILELMIITNYSMYAANIILSFGVLSALFYKVSNPSIRKLIPAASVIFAICAVFSIVNGDGIRSYNSMVSALASFIITAYCLMYFYWKLVTNTKVAGLTESSFFWIVIGLFTYYTGSFFIFMSYKYLIVQGDNNIVSILWRFHNVLLTIFCSYTIYGLTCKDYRKT